jgi:hypothetical protein
VDALDHRSRSLAARSRRDNAANPLNHAVEISRDHRSKNPADAVVEQPLAGTSQILCPKVIRIKINARVAIYLEVKESSHVALNWAAH